MKLVNSCSTHQNGNHFLIVSKVICHPILWDFVFSVLPVGTESDGCINKDLLLVQLQTFHANFKIEDSMSIHNVIEMMKNMTEAQKNLFSEVVKLTRLLLVVPATNAVSERSFSAMRRLKTYLRSTMKQERLNAIMIMHIHKDLLDTLDLKFIANEFRSKKDYRKNKFPIF